MSVTLYHNPRCSKSRAALLLLEERDYPTQIINYLKTPPSKADLETILSLLKMEPRDLMRKKELPYKENNLADPSLSRDQLIQAMIDHPKLMERPIVLANGKAAIGRPIENVIAIL
ncbi:MAG: arsenate reductase (glutaredoxin) [Magnetococcales bacterium]|nr:arsenate reductase (glutaredoxin) [Magnetococcales bacterium]